MSTPEKPELERWKIAFGVDVLRRIAAADGTLHAAERAAIEGAYPDGRLRELGFLDDTGLTRAWAVAAAEARRELPARLSQAEKLLLLGFFHTVSLVDGALDPGEVRQVHEAAMVLGVSIAELGAHLDQITGVSGAVPPRRR